MRAGGLELPDDLQVLPRVSYGEDFAMKLLADIAAAIFGVLFFIGGQLLSLVLHVLYWTGIWNGRK